MFCIHFFNLFLNHIKMVVILQPLGSIAICGIFANLFQGFKN